MDETGLDRQELGQHIGKAPHRITERTVAAEAGARVSVAAGVRQPQTLRGNRTAPG